MNPQELVQRSKEWYAYRGGRVTGSRIADVVTRTKAGAYSAKRATYMKLLVAERLAGSPQNGRNVRSLDERSDLEPKARTAYELYHNSSVRLVGFIDHPTIVGAGCSPDGLVDPDGMTEFKVPDAAQHCEMMETGEIDEGYLAQIQFGLACSGRRWCDFGSYCPTMPERFKLWTRRIPRNDPVITQIESEVMVFISEVDAKVEMLMERTR